jgi:glycosyltransferase involved in cell wall biosynthesis
MMQRLRLEDGVHIAGRVKDIWPYLADADVYALASPSEALGIAVMEAMAAGLPVVASNVGGIPELVTRGVTGELFDPPDHRALARELISLLGSPERRRAMSAEALEAAAEMRMETSIAAYCQLYDRLLEGAGGPCIAGARSPASTRETR